VTYLAVTVTVPFCDRDLPCCDRDRTFLWPWQYLAVTVTVACCDRDCTLLWPWPHLAVTVIASWASLFIHSEEYVGGCRP